MRPECRQLVLSCEHASNAVPAAWRALLDDKALLSSHHGWDIGALELARHLARHLQAPLEVGRVTRLLVDLNRSPRHPKLHSEAIRQLNRAARKDILARHYWPYRDAVTTQIENRLEQGLPVLHMSVHSFTPVYIGEARRADIGLLYDPSRPAEKALCQQWQILLRSAVPDWRIRRNYPYTGVQDGFIPALRRQFADPGYVGVELEVNQALVGSGDWPAVKRRLTESLAALISTTA